MGAWEEVAISYRDVEGHYCECCGKHVARYIYTACVDGEASGDASPAHRFCSPDCADLYAWYWLPRYERQGSAIRSSQ